jgi:hypothetical protein
MTDSRTPAETDRRASVWIDHNQAVIVGEGPMTSDPTVNVLVRASLEPEASFQARIVEDVADDARILVAGESAVRTAFDREFVAITHHPERLVDSAPARQSKD